MRNADDGTRKAPDLLSPAQAARRLPGRPNPSTIIRWIIRGVRGRRLEAVRVGGRYFIDPADLERFVERPVAGGEGVGGNRRHRAAVRRLARRGLVEGRRP